MHIDITFGGALIEHLPEGHKGNRLKYSFTNGVTLTDLLNELQIDPNQRLLVILNGNVVPKESFTLAQLSDNDKLSLMPPIQAG